jgi:flavodoxin
LLRKRFLQRPFFPTIEKLFRGGETANLKTSEAIEAVRGFKLVKVLIVYESVSLSQVTASVAETVRGVLRERGVEVDSFSVADVDRADVRDYDCLLAGAPTMAFRASKGIIQFLDSLPNEGFSGKLAAAFDTQSKFRFSGSAAKGIEGKLKGLGFKLVAAPLIAYIEGAGKGEWRLKEGEQEKAEKWAQEVADALLKQSPMRALHD